MLHGQPGTARDWTAVAAALDGRATAIAIDRPGWDGRSEPRDLAGNAQAALAALDQRGVQRATVVGHSFGAAVAAWLAAHHPDRVAALVLAAPAANVASLEPFDRWLALPFAGRLTSGAALTGLGLALSIAPIRRRIARGPGLDDRYLRTTGRALLSPWARRAFHVEQRNLIADLWALEPRLADVPTPTWIISGNEDRVVALAASRALSEQIRGARLVILRPAGHLLPQLHSRQLADAIVTAIDELPGGPAAARRHAAANSRHERR